MTTGEMISELKSSLGNRTDITDARYTVWLNWGLFDLCGFHMRRLVSPKRFHVLEDSLLFATAIRKNLCGATVSGTTFQLTGGDAVAAPDYYNDTVVELTDYSGDAPDGLLDQKFVIYDYAGAGGGFVATIAGTWDVNPDTNTYYTIYRRNFSLNDVLFFPGAPRVWAVERIENLVDGGPVDHVDWSKLVGIDITDVGEPSSFANRGNRIMFDKPVDDAYFYRMFFYRLPALLSDADLPAVCEIPEDWHEMIVLGGVWRGFQKLMEPDRSLEAKGRYQSAVRDHQDAFQIAEVNVKRQMRVRM